MGLRGKRLSLFGTWGIFAGVLLGLMAKSWQARSWNWQVFEQVSYPILYASGVICDLPCRFKISFHLLSPFLRKNVGMNQTAVLAFALRNTLRSCKGGNGSFNEPASVGFDVLNNSFKRKNFPLVEVTFLLLMLTFGLLKCSKNTRHYSATAGSFCCFYHLFQHK